MEADTQCDNIAQGMKRIYRYNGSGNWVRVTGLEVNQIAKWVYIIINTLWV